MSRAAAALVMTAALALGLTGCRPADTAAGAAPERAPAAEAAPAPPPLYIAVGALVGTEASRDLEEGLKLAGEELGVRTELAGPADYDLAAAEEAIDRAAARKPAGLIVVGWDETLGAAVDRAADQGVPVVTVEADLPASKRIAYVGTSDLRAGAEIGAWLARKLAPAPSAEPSAGATLPPAPSAEPSAGAALPPAPSAEPSAGAALPPAPSSEPARVAVIGMTDLPGVRERLEGLRAALSARGITIVQVGNSMSDAVASARTAREIMLRHPDLDALVGLDSHSGLGIGAAVRQAGNADRILAVGWGRDNALLEMVGAGELDATAVRRAALMPYYAVLLFRQLQGSRVSLSRDDAAAGIRNAPVFIDAGVAVVERDGAGGLVR